MREIKFRAWDKEDNRLKRVTLMDFPEWSVCVQNQEEYYEIGDRNSFKNEETDRCILMQYTGLKDKNGVEIYEGDILGYVSEDEGKSYRERVGWDKEQLCWGLTNSESYTVTLAEMGDGVGEVIGNIYENPELVE